jgi:orotidine 5'-phosphate decarboxylase subfamily 2
METFFSFLERRVDDSSSLLCIGLDPHVSDLDSPSAASALDFCQSIVKATARYAAAFKPNAAFFEYFGPEGWRALKGVIEAVQAESDRLGSMIPVILDAKRGDIASTAEAYAKSAFKVLGAHAITLNPYLGKDSIEPFLGYKEKGVFLLCKTSNPSAGEIQDLPVVSRQFAIDSKPATTNQQPPTVLLYEHVAFLAQQWNVKNNIGLVVGATQPQSLSRVRAIAQDLWFLTPGIGAQGGKLHAALKAGLRTDGKGMLINVSRSIAQAAEGPGLAAAELRDEIINIRRDLKL